MPTIFPIALFFFLFFLSLVAPARGQAVDDFFYLEPSSRELPVQVRGQLDNGILLLFVQGGPGENALDFARIDYPGWKHTLEKEVAIAYYDQRGLNKKARKIDPSKITFDQYSKDLMALTERLKQQYPAEVFLMGHSAGGYMVYHCLSTYPDNPNISGAIVLNTPLTTDHSPERYHYFRPLYLKNLAREFIERGNDTEKWQEALDWMVATDSIHSPETSRQWNRYVDSAFEPARRRIKAVEVLKVIFGKPYHPFKYLYRKDNELAADLLWADEAHLHLFERLPHITHPVLLLTGRYDDIAPPEEIRAASQLMRNATAVILPDAAHESFLDQPERFVREILVFLGIKK